MRFYLEICFDVNSSPHIKQLVRKAFPIDHGDLAVIFSNIEILLEIHEEMLKKFLEVNKKWPALDGIGDLFVKMVNYGIWEKGRSSAEGRETTEDERGQYDVSCHHVTCHSPYYFLLLTSINSISISSCFVTRSSLVLPLLSLPLSPL